MLYAKFSADVRNTDKETFANFLRNGQNVCVRTLHDSVTDLTSASRVKDINLFIVQCTCILI